MEKHITKSRLVAIILFTVFATTAVLIALMYMIYPYIAKSNTDLYEKKLAEITALVNEYYVGEVDENTVADFIAAGYAEGLGDKYSAYITKEYSKEAKNSMVGTDSGFGVNVSREPDTGNMLVIRVYTGGPAEKAGILEYDEIVSVDSQGVSEIGYTETLEYIGKKSAGDSVAVEVLREGKKVNLSVTIDTFDVQTVFYEKVGNIGLITITSFKENSVEQFKAALDNANSDAVDALTFDLRGNGGGMVDAVCKMLDLLLPKGTIIDVKYKNSAHDERYTSDDGEVNLPMAVLTDENTASASELFTQSLIDYGKAISIGRKTFGKGIVQRTFTLSDGSLFKFTIAKYYTASGICVDGVGITPAVEIEWSEDELKYRYKNGIEKDKDFAAAVEYLNGQLS